MDFQAGGFAATSQVDHYVCQPDDRRGEPRLEGVTDGAMLCFRGEFYRVPVINISSRGTMIESGIAPRLGESVVIRFDGCSPMHAFVRWWRDGRIGLNFGCEIILG